MVKNIKISEICSNTGQINRLPKNPRVIKDENFEKLKKSLQDDPEMLELREILVYPFEGKYICIGGNMRYKAAKEIGLTELPCKVLDENTPVEKLQAYTIKDNSSFGKWDFAALKEFDEILIEDCCIDEPSLPYNYKEDVETNKENLIFPIMILQTEKEAIIFDQIKDDLGSKTDLDCFSKILEFYQKNK